MEKSHKLNPKYKGDRFEQEIADLYTAIGYEVSRNVPIAGQEVDILAVRSISGSNPYRVMVECKFKRGTQPAGNEDVQSIAGAFHLAKTVNQVSACTIVTTNRYTLAAQEAASAAGIHLTTRRQLIRGLIDFSSYLKDLKARYVEDFGQGGESWYIDPKVRRESKEFESLDCFVDDWLACTTKAPLALLGGYGTGKTSFCRHYAVRLLNRADSPIPILLPLRDFRKATRIDSLIRDFLDEHCNASSPRFATFWRMYQEGLLVLLLDGLDEMSTGVDASVLEANLTELDRFARLGNLILTCRPESFISRGEELSSFRPLNELLSDRMAVYEPVEVALWTSEQIALYIEKRVQSMKPRPRHPAKYYTERINRLPELHDMSTRAVHLDLIVKILPRIIEQGIVMTRPNLYRTYIKHELRREAVANKRLRTISDQRRLKLMRDIGADRLLRSRNALTFQAASRLVRSSLRLPSPEVEPVTRDLLNRSFLRRDGDLYHFAHQSVGEYLLALEVCDRIRAERFDFLKSSAWSHTVAGLTLDLFGGPEAFNTMLAALKINRTGPVTDLDQALRVAFAAVSVLDHLSTLTGGRPKVTPRQKRDLAWEWVGGLIYELRNAIAVVVGYGDLLRDETVKLDPTKLPRYFHHISSQWPRVLAYFEALRQFRLNRLTGEPKPLFRKSEVDLVPLLRTAVRCMPPGKALVGGKCRPYWGDVDYLTSVFENIALNAKIWAKQRGRLIVHVSDDHKANAVRIIFANSGPQIPSDIIGKIFDFGFTTRPDGHGIGLAIAKNMVMLHGGTIRVRSDAHKTTFEVFLPRIWRE